MIKKIITWLSWVILAGVMFWSYQQIIQFAIFPQSWKIPFLAALIILWVLLGVLIYVFRNKSIGQVLPAILNVILSVCLVGCTLYLPTVEKRMSKIISSVSDTEIVVMDIYALSPDYKAQHADVFADAVQSAKLSDYKNSNVVIQNNLTAEVHDKSVEKLMEKLEVNVLESNTIWEGLEALYNNEAQAILIPDSYLPTIMELETYKNFSNDAVLLDTIIVQLPKGTSTTNIQTQKPFSVFVAGSDTRSGELSIYGRTDVDIMLSVDPVNKQALIVSIPRDFYIPNPALGNGLDKLTHLGNDGITNTMIGLNQYFGINMESYGVVNFQTFTKIVDSIGGIDIDNPYAFTNQNGADVNLNGYSYPAGPLHLDGNKALAYVRERYSLENGDMDRVEHQAIVLQAIIKKITSKEIIVHFDSLLNNLEGTVATNISLDSIYELASDQLSYDGEWNVVYYHLTETGDMLETASMPGQALYVGHPIDSQVTFIRNEMNKILNGEPIEQKELPMA